MTMKQNHSTIEAELEAAHFGDGEDGMKRARIASAIRDTGAYFGQKEAARLRAHFAVGYVGLAAVEAIEAALLDGTWRQVEAEMRAKEAEQSGDPNQRNEASAMQHVTEANPYGWAKPERMLRTDTDVPGKWNPYRQAVNLTTQERAKAHARDHKVRGCTRWEVLGNKGQPSVAFNAEAVQHAKGQATEGEVAAAAKREVYGESR